MESRNYTFYDHKKFLLELVRPYMSKDHRLTHEMEPSLCDEFGLNKIICLKGYLKSIDLRVNWCYAIKKAEKEELRSLAKRLLFEELMKLRTKEGL